MARLSSSRWGVSATVAVVGLAVLPSVASAHGVTTSRFQSPLPLSWLFAGAAATVAATALWLVAGDRSERTTGGERTIVAIPTTLSARVRRVAALLFLGLVVVALLAGVLGRQVASENLATVFTWPVWFRGVAIVAILFGNPWVTLAPWRTLYRGLSRLEGRPLALFATYPRILAAWPAVVGFVVLIGVVENLTILPRSPASTTGLVAAYALVMVGGGLLFGRRWFERADPLGVLYRLFGRVAPLGLAAPEEGQHCLVVRPPWLGCLDPFRSLSLVVFAVATVYTVSFDGFTNTRPFQSVLFAVRDALGTGPETSILLYLLGLAGFVAVFLFACWLVDRLGSRSAPEWRVTARWFAPTILPIAAAYEIAHNYPYVLRNAGQALATLVAPIAPGVGAVDPLAWLSVPAFWASQVGLIVLGHVIAVVAAHHVAVRRYDSIDAARRGHLPLVVLMVGYTVLSLWIVSRPVVAA